MKRLLLTALCAPIFAIATEIPSVSRSSERALPSDEALRQNTQEGQKSRELQNQLDAALGKLVEKDAQIKSLATTPTSVAVLENEDEETLPQKSLLKRKPQRSTREARPTIFAVSATNLKDQTLTVLPTGSHVKARVVSGVEANSREPYPVLLQLDYAFTGPNKSRINLQNCFMIARAKANMSTERVMMETESLSCVRDSGEAFKKEAKGYIAGSDSTFGATGTYISKQSQVLLAAVLASIAKNAGQAVGDAQKSTTVIGAGDKAAIASNVTGNKAAFVAGSAVVDGASMVAQWYLEQAKELIPSIGVGSGQDVFVIMLDTVEVPAISDGE